MPSAMAQPACPAGKESPVIAAAESPVAARSAAPPSMPAPQQSVAMRDSMALFLQVCPGRLAWPASHLALHASLSPVTWHAVVPMQTPRNVHSWREQWSKSQPSLRMMSYA